ncbi:MAG: Ni/Fe hydrogenase subunit alpha [Candidatus Eisenbacteria bacterium]|uniref:Ni/Fe hydrogenase subunit alpha n=1 Tax=Eiseniibacteriota bacterium TaxID=2212470 RepID=A0A956NBI6_UNCEI|nr:Ni/Fe hydrogenase subunit alpha [Candidatus Eisenbacteria bacterium]
MTTSTKRIAIEPLSRVEGHGKVTIHLDPDGRVVDAKLHIVEFRGFERFIQGRPYWELPVLVQRLCGICPVSHHLCAAKAVDIIAGRAQLTPTGEKMRRLMHYGQILQSHALHFFHLSSPDLLFGFEAPRDKRTVTEVIRAHPDLAKRGVLLRKYGQEIILATAGKKVHGTGAIPGGINKNLRPEERDSLLHEIETILGWAESSVSLARDYTLEHLEQLAGFGAFPSNHVAIVGPDGEMDLYDGKLRAVDAEGRILADQLDPMDYLDYLAEEVRSWSYMKFPFLTEFGPERGWYRVGPLARLNVCTRIDTPRAETRRQEFQSHLGSVCNVTMAYHWARMVEMLHAAEKIEQLLRDPDLQSMDLVAPVSQPSRRSVAVLEAPRGTLLHHYEVNEHDQVTKANLIVSTTHNNEAMNRTVRRIAEDHLSGRKELTESLLNNVEVGIRAYDPCLSCATHALGQMPLHVALLDSSGATIDERSRG